MSNKPFFNNKLLNNLKQDNILDRGSPSIDFVSDRPIYSNKKSFEKFAKKNINKSNLIYNHLNVLSTDLIGCSYYIIEKLYRENIWAFRTPNNIASVCLATKPLFKIKQPKHTYKKRVVKNITNILLKPNKFTTGYQLFYLTILSLIIYGNSYWQVIKRKDGSLHSLYHLPTASMRVQPFIDENNIIDYAYICVDNIEKMAFNRYYFSDEIIHFKMPNNPFSTIYGITEFLPLFQDFTFDIEGNNWLNSWFQKAFSGGSIFKMENSNHAIVKRNREYLKEKYEGSQNAGRTMILEGDMSLVYDGNKARDINLSALKNISRETIITGLGMPLSAYGIRSDSGQANAEVIESEDRALLRNTITKLHNILYGTIEMQLINLIMGESELSIMAGMNNTFNNKNASDIVQSASKFAGTTINENRELLGIPTQDESIEDIEETWFNTPVVATNNGMLPLNIMFDTFANGLNTGVDTANSNNPTLNISTEKTTAKIK